MNLNMGDFIKNYPSITNRNIVSFISGYGVILFFLDLASYLRKQNRDKWKELYFDISNSYYLALNYFNEH